MMRQWIGLTTLLVACEQPPPSAPRPAAPPTQAAVTYQTTPVADAAAPPTAVVRVERTPAPPKKVNDVWVFETPGQLLDAYGDGQALGRLRVSGPVGGVIELGGAAGTRLLLGPAGRRFVEVRFRDVGAEAVRKRVGQGSLVSVECTAAGRVGKNAQLTDCVLQ